MSVMTHHASATNATCREARQVAVACMRKEGGAERTEKLKHRQVSCSAYLTARLLKSCGGVASFRLRFAVFREHPDTQRSRSTRR